MAKSNTSNDISDTRKYQITTINQVIALRCPKNYNDIIYQNDELHIQETCFYHQL